MKKLGITWQETVGNPECPVMTRTVMALGAFSLRLHSFSADHEDAHAHSHPWWFLTVVLQGGYEDISAGGHVDRLHLGSVRLRTSNHTHRTRVGLRGCRTLVVTGPLSNDWGFWVDGRFFPWRIYRRAFPSPPCSPTRAEAGSISPADERESVLTH